MLCALQGERLWAVDFAFASCLKRSEPDCLDQESPPLGIGCLEKCTNYSRPLQKNLALAGAPSVGGWVLISFLFPEAYPWPDTW